MGQIRSGTRYCGELPAGCRKVGVDVEKVRHWPRRTWQSFLTVQEQACLARQTAADFNRLATLWWGVKEAYLKAKGCGLRQHPVTVEVRPKKGKGLEVYDQGIRIQGLVSYGSLGSEGQEEHIVVCVVVCG